MVVLALLGISLVMLLVFEWRTVVPLLMTVIAINWISENPWIAAAFGATLAALIALVIRYAPAPQQAAKRPILERRSEAERAAIRAEMKRRMAGG